MNTLKELKLLARMQAAQGIVDEDLLGRIAIEEQKLEQQQIAEQAVSESRKTAFQSMFADLSKDIGKLLADEKKKTEEEQQLLDRFATVLSRIDEIKEAQPEAIPESILEPIVETTSIILAPQEPPVDPPIKDPVKDVADKIKVTKPPSMFVQPEPPVVSRDIKDIQSKLKMLEGWVSKISMTGPGGGEVNLRYLDDVARNTISNGLYLRYNEPTKKFIFDRGHYDNFYGAFQSTVTQNCGASTATALTYNQVDFSYGVTVTNNSQVVLEYPGLYNAQFSVQLRNTGTSIDAVYIWLRQNGVDVAGSTGKIDIPSKHGNGDGAILIGWNFYINTTVANEYFEFMWFTPDETHITIPTLPAQAAVNAISPAIPGTASVVLTVSPVKIS